jgi:hypothetical protein
MLWFAPDDSDSASELAPISAQAENTEESELWRELEVGETIREGDQYWRHGVGPWESTTLNTYRPGQIDTFHAKHRRRVRVESPGWRYLDEGETVNAGDECQSDRGCRWGKCLCTVGDRVLAISVRFFRRKISPG